LATNIKDLVLTFVDIVTDFNIGVVSDKAVSANTFESSFCINTSLASPVVAVTLAKCAFINVLTRLAVIKEATFTDTLVRAVRVLTEHILVTIANIVELAFINIGASSAVFDVSWLARTQVSTWNIDTELCFIAIVLI